jgi:hypothetical protein
MRGRAVLFAAVSVAACSGTAGCAATVRGNVGVAATNVGAEPLAGGSLGFGFARKANQVLLVGGAQAGTRGVLMTLAPEYDRNLRSKDHPLGLRVRLDAGAEYVYARPSTGSPLAAVLGVVPGVFWMPLQSVHAPHRFVLAIEPRIGARLPVYTGAAPGPWGELSVVFEYDWVPCTIFGAGSCSEKSPDGGGP